MSTNTCSTHAHKPLKVGIIGAGSIGLSFASLLSLDLKSAVSKSTCFNHDHNIPTSSNQPPNQVNNSNTQDGKNNSIEVTVFSNRKSLSEQVNRDNGVYMSFPNIANHSLITAHNQERSALITTEYNGIPYIYTSMRGKTMGEVVDLSLVRHCAKQLYSLRRRQSNDKGDITVDSGLSQSDHATNVTVGNNVNIHNNNVNITQLVTDGLDSLYQDSLDANSSDDNDLMAVRQKWLQLQHLQTKKQLENATDGNLQNEPNSNDFIDIEKLYMDIADLVLLRSTTGGGENNKHRTDSEDKYDLVVLAMKGHLSVLESTLFGLNILSYNSLITVIMNGLGHREIINDTLIVCKVALLYKYLKQEYQLYSLNNDTVNLNTIDNMIKKLLDYHFYNISTTDINEYINFILSHVSQHHQQHQQQQLSSLSTLSYLQLRSLLSINTLVSVGTVSYGARVDMAPTSQTTMSVTQSPLSVTQRPMSMVTGWGSMSLVKVDSVIHDRMLDNIIDKLDYNVNTCHNSPTTASISSKNTESVNTTKTNNNIPILTLPSGSRDSVVWSKLFVNALLNPVCALSAVRNGGLAKSFSDILNVFEKTSDEDLCRFVKSYNNELTSYNDLISSYNSNNKSLMNPSDSCRLLYQLFCEVSSIIRVKNIVLDVGNSDVQNKMASIYNNSHPLSDNVYSTEAVYIRLMVKKMFIVTSLTKSNKCSMLTHVINNVTTENEYICDILLNYARDCGLYTPVLADICTRIQCYDELTA